MIGIDVDHGFPRPAGHSHADKNPLRHGTGQAARREPPMAGLLLLPSRTRLHHGRVDGSKGSCGYSRDVGGGNLRDNRKNKLKSQDMFFLVFFSI